MHAVARRVAEIERAHAAAAAAASAGLSSSAAEPPSLSMTAFVDALPHDAITVRVERSDFAAAFAKMRPSVSEAEYRRYRDLFIRFSRGDGAAFEE
jgi:cyclopropane fatty-acyl-phospholipid synthase-like methyltransferase